MEADERKAISDLAVAAGSSTMKPLWTLDIEEITGHNIETRARADVNRLLQSGCILLHIYTLRYQEAGVWRDRPMAILGRPKAVAPEHELTEPHR